MGEVVLDPRARAAVENVVANLLDKAELPVVIISARSDGTASVTISPATPDEVARALLEQAFQKVGGTPESVVSPDRKPEA